MTWGLGLRPSLCPTGGRVGDGGDGSLLVSDDQRGMVYRIVYRDGD
ncbi:MAG: hypothetical protein VX293_12225 [Candidatus Latescibacterota bacterium]|nr:hypothetical protein [Candidatus Latescibacterota bacterium]